MKNSNSTSSQDSSPPAAPQALGFSPRQWLKTKRISYLTLPLLAMATVTEFVILATGWKYQKVVCLPQGMGVTFLGIGPIGATILACELLKLPLAIWTASRQGWQKGFMLVVGLPLICVLTFQLVKDMAVYEMGVAMTPASQMLEKASAEDIKIAQLNAELKGVEEKRGERDRKLAELAAKQGKAKAELEESIKRNEAARQDAINLTEYQKKELSEVQAREANIIAQFNADTEQLTKTVADLRARREVEVGRATKWNAEEARIENAYKTKMTEYANKKAAYDKDKAEYDGANFLKRQLMKEPVSPGVPPEREANTILKPTLVAELDGQIKAKEAELLAVNNKRRDRVAQVDADARRLREQFDTRSGTKREEADKKREELSAALAALAKEEKTEREQMDKEFDSAVQTVDGIKAQIDACRKQAEGFYEAREASIRKTQVHRIATTVEIVRGLIKGERPMSIKATAKERGDILTDQISMVRIWVYPVLAFIVAFLPTLMVEIGFSTVFQPEQVRPAHRLGFLGRRLHWVYIRAGRIKMLRAERLARQASGQIAARDQALAQKETELQTAREALSAAAAEHEEQLKKTEAEHVEQAKKKETEWAAKLAATADSLNRAIVEKDALRDSQNTEVERQIQLRQGAWSDRLGQSRRELDEQRAAYEAQRTAMMQDHHGKLMQVTEDYRTQLVQARRQIEEAELAAVEKSARLAHDLKEAQEARETAEAQLKHETDGLTTQLSQAQEDAARELEKAARQEKNRLERQQLEADKTLRQKLQQQESAFQAKLKQREEELAIKAAARETELQNQFTSDLRTHEEEWERRAESRVNAIETRLRHEAQQKEELFLSKSRQRDQQWQVKLDALRAEAQGQTTEFIRRGELAAEAARREVETQLRKEIKEKEEEFQGRWKQREQELATQLDAQAEAHLVTARAQWETESEKKARAAAEAFMAELGHLEKERDEAKQTAADSVRQLQNLEKKLTEASSFLSGWKNGKRPVEEVETSRGGRTGV
ncbi:MAG TPA: hypothetical protein VNZ64_26380 [Candidatus Acidoferrum sp.]|jgi:hypothetical protein|nr:hypothetical protein [Candidatus Acidoferrum sp.]